MRLSEEVAGKYELAGGAYPGQMVLPERKQWGEHSRKVIDFRTLTLAEAEKLVALENFPYLKLRKKRSWEKSNSKPLNSIHTMSKKIKLQHVSESKALAKQAENLGKKWAKQLKKNLEAGVYTQEAYDQYSEALNGAMALLSQAKAAMDADEAKITAEVE